MLSMTTNFVKSDGCPEPYLKKISEAGFSRVHWAHHWNDDFLYSKPEIEQIRTWLRDYSLELGELHGSSGQEKSWGSNVEYERLAGVELVANRLHMAAELSCDVVIMHLFGAPDDPRPDRPVSSAMKSLDELEPIARSCGVRIAIENGHFKFIEQVVPKYAPDYVGVCYDAGHGNFGGRGLPALEPLTDRLIAVHAHDNDESDDSHVFPFSKTVDWPRLSRIIAESPIDADKGVAMEVLMLNSGIEDENEFLAEAFRTGTQLSEMIRAQ